MMCYVGIYHNSHVEVRGQLSGIGFIPLLLLSLVGVDLGVEVLSHTVCNFCKAAKLFLPVVTLCDLLCYFIEIV